MDDVQGAASVARAWSGYVDALSGGVIANATASTVGEMHEHLLAKTPDFLAFAVCLAYCALLAIGVKGSAYFNRSASSSYTSFKTKMNLLFQIPELSVVDPRKSCRTWK